MKDSGSFVKALDNDQLAQALLENGLASSPVGDGFRVDAEALQIGKIAAANQITLIELRPADGGLEDLFLELTADTQRDEFTQGVTGMSAAQQIDLDKGPWATIEGQVLDVSGTPRVPFARLVSVELRRARDTRAGLWLLVSIGDPDCPRCWLILIVALTRTVSFNYGTSSDPSRAADGAPAAGDGHHAGDQRVEPAHGDDRRSRWSRTARRVVMAKLVDRRRARRRHRA